MCVSPDSRFYFRTKDVNEDKKELLLQYNLRDEQLEIEYEYENDYVRCAQVDSENFLYICTDDGKFNIYDIESKKKIGELPKHDTGLHWLCVNHKNDECAVSDDDGLLILIEIRDRSKPEVI